MMSTNVNTELGSEKPILVGTHYGGFHYPSDMFSRLSADSFIVCIGAGEDILHDLIIAARTGADVHVVDPTPRAVAHVERVKRILAREEAAPRTDPRSGGGDSSYWSRMLDLAPEEDAGKKLAARIHMHPVAISGSCGRAWFYPPDNPEHVSHSLVRGMTSAKRASKMVDVLSLAAFCERVGRRPSELALLKMDVEGAELDILKGMLGDSTARPLFLTVEFDRGWRGQPGTRDRPACDRMIRQLCEAGYTQFYRLHADHTFIRN
jgi:FkbM family methyltransferase